MTQEDKIKVIIELYSKIKNSDLAKMLGMNSGLIIYYARKFNLKKEGELLQNQMNQSVNKMIEARKLYDLRYNLLREQDMTYWERVKEFRKQQFETHGRFHPFYKLQIKTQANG
jgi:transposase